uniref:Knottins-like domain-containing protein n=2 Tax=Solanum TaxID=4107 RepID=A0A3Q7H588_SOLLC
MIVEVQAQHMCKSTSQTFKGLCFTYSSCRKGCLKEKFEGGHYIVANSKGSAYALRFVYLTKFQMN